MAKAGIKIFIIHNKKPISEAIHIIRENSIYQNHLQYWQEHLSKKKYKYVSLDDLYKNTRNLIAIKIALEENIVFMDTSKKDREYRSGILYLPKNVSANRKKLAAILTSSYDYLNIIYDIFYDGKTYRAKEKDIMRSEKKFISKRILKLP